MSLLQVLSDIASLQSTVAILQSNVSTLQSQVSTLTTNQNTNTDDVNDLKTYTKLCEACGRNELPYHVLYTCSNCGWKKNRNCQKVCRVCNFRNYDFDSGDVTKKECNTCHINYPVADYNTSGLRCKYCDLVFITYRNATKYYLDF